MPVARVKAASERRAELPYESVVRVAQISQFERKPDEMREAVEIVSDAKQRENGRYGSTYKLGACTLPSTKAAR